MEAARHWAAVYTGQSTGGRTVAARDRRVAELLRKHASKEKLAEFLAARGVDDSESDKPGVVEDNWNTVSLFLRLSNQWERVGMIGAFVGIPVDRITATVQLSGQTLTPEEFEGLQLMEAVAKPLLNDALKDR